MSSTTKNMLLRLSIGCWLLVTFAALTGMYQLWLQRERVLYLGKRPAEQRRTVFERAGLPPVLADKTAKLAAQWPVDLRYKARGDANALSYIQYLLIPRIPSSKAAHVLEVKGDTLTVSGPPVGQSDTASLPEERSSPKGLILSFAVLLGWAALLRKMWRGRATWPECFALACLFFTLLVLPVRVFFHSAAPAFGGAIILALVGWAMLLGNALVRRLSPSRSAPAPAALPGRERFLIGLLGLIIALAVLWSFLMAVVVVPDDWDAWATWGSKAKVLALGSGPLKDVTRFSHPDYPLLWPAVWALSGWLTGGWEECWSKGWGAVFLLLCLWEMIAAVRRQSGSLLAGFFAAALFVSMPNVPLIASWGYAEAPLWLMMTCGLSAFLRWQSDSRQADAVLAALFAAGAALTKNEGLLFALLLGLMFLSSGRLKATALYLLAFAGSFAFWFWWSRLHLDLSSQAAAGLHCNTASLRHAAGRLRPAIKAIWAMWKNIRQWNVVGFGIALALPVMLCRRGSTDRRLLFLPIALLAGYLAIILFNSNEIYWQIGTAWNRLTVQTLPLMLMLLVPPGWERMNNARGDYGACSQKDENRQSDQ